MNKKRILIVDDEKDVVNTLKIWLEARGHEALCAYNGEEALKQVRAQIPDLIILDLGLPGISGYMVCSLLKNDQRFSHIPVIICTARTQEEDIKVGKQAGADAYLTKPLELQILADTIQKLLP